METNPEVSILYTNWRGETAVRRILPSSVRFASTDWHPSPQWLLWARDVDKGEMREFAMNDILAWGDVAIAKFEGATK